MQSRRKWTVVPERLSYDHVYSRMLNGGARASREICEIRCQAFRTAELGHFAANNLGSTLLAERLFLLKS